LTLPTALAVMASPRCPRSRSVARSFANKSETNFIANQAFRLDFDNTKIQFPVRMERSMGRSHETVLRLSVFNQEAYPWISGWFSCVPGSMLMQCSHGLHRLRLSKCHNEGLLSRPTGPARILFGSSR
jgi:hypothetical protein